MTFFGANVSLSTLYRVTNPPTFDACCFYFLLFNFLNVVAIALFCPFMCGCVGDRGEIQVCALGNPVK